MKTIAVLGASGFVGVRLVEMLHLGGVAQVRPIFYRPASMAPLARFQLDWRMAEYSNPSALAAALQGCDTLVHLATGDPKIIRNLTTPVYEAAARAGVRRMVFLSSASVYGQAPATGTNDSSPLPRRHRFPYNAAKVEAERRLRVARTHGKTELVVLRPGIVWGPRSRWIVDTMRTIRAGTFGWLNNGQGTINPIYVDNLVHAIVCASSAPADGQNFLLNDPEPGSWREFFTPWLEACGKNPADVPGAPPYVPARGLKARFERVRVHELTQQIAPKIPSVLKQMVKALVAKAPAQSIGAIETVSGPPQPAQLSEEMTVLEECQWRFPVKHAHTQLGWTPPVSWPTAVERTLGWLRFADLLPSPK